MTRTVNHPPSEEVAMFSVTMMLKVFLLPNNTQETLSSHLQTPSLRNYLPRVAHNRNHPVAKALSKATLLPSPTTTPTRKINTTVPRTIQATVFLSSSSSIPPCSSLALLPRVLHPLLEASKVPARCSLSRTIMVVGSTINNTSSQPQPTMISDISTMLHNTITHKE